MGLVIVDNCLLQVLTSVQRLDILDAHHPLTISRCVRQEHEGRAPDPAEGYLQAQLKAGNVRVLAPVHSDRYKALYHKYQPILGHCDAVILAWGVDTADDGSYLLSDDRGLLEFAKAEGAECVDLSAILISCRDTGRLNKNQLRDLVKAIEARATHTVAAATKKELGV